MKVHQYYTQSSLRNFTYFLEYEEAKALVIDPYDADQCIDFLREKNLLPTHIVNTHEHWDHIQGNSKLKEKFGIKVYAHKRAAGLIPEADIFLEEGDSIHLSSEHSLNVLDTPGHTHAHLCLLLIEKEHPHAIFTGDTLFNAGVGHCRDGDSKVLYQTVSKKFGPLADELTLYPGHDYFVNNLRFTLSVEKSNKEASSLLRECESLAQEGKWRVSSLGLERKVNTFLRLGEEGVKNGVCKDREGDVKKLSDEETFIRLRSLRDKW